MPSGKGPDAAVPVAPWRSPVEDAAYDRAAELTALEQTALVDLMDCPYRWGEAPGHVFARVQDLTRLTHPLRAALEGVEGSAASKDRAVAALVRACGREHRSYWGWDAVTWRRVLGPTQADFFAYHGPQVDGDVRQYMMAAGYLLACAVDISHLGSFKRRSLAQKIFGVAAVEEAVTPIREAVVTWGYGAAGGRSLEATVCEALLRNRSPVVGSLPRDHLEGFRDGRHAGARSRFLQLDKALASLQENTGTAGIPRGRCRGGSPSPGPSDLPEEWRTWMDRWEDTSTLTPSTRHGVQMCLGKVGRWLRHYDGTVTSPAQWTRAVAIAFVAALSRMSVGDYTGARAPRVPQWGQPLSARTQATYLGSLRTFFRDCQAWGWIPVRFDPDRVLATPRSVRALIGPAPRTISADPWAKLLWAGLNLTADDLPRGTANYYPVEFVKAVALVWLFAGLRSDELVRLRVGCVRWQADAVAVPMTGEVLPAQAVCFLDIPVSKTGTAFTKPVDPAVGHAITAWEQLRPVQPRSLDRKTGEAVDFLFCFRARPLMREYVNRTLIPVLCGKAGIPTQDVRGPITSHRARSTIASQLYNAREPLSLFELQAWLGHRSPTSTQSYVAWEPTRLAKAYHDAGYFARNLRAIHVLIDQEAIRAGQGADGAPWRYYDLGHGLCTYEFFDQCPHRMACARCDFYVPRHSHRGQLLAAQSHMLRMLQEIPLTDDERLAVEGDARALERLVQRLEVTPTPSGQRPRELHDPPTP